MRIRWKFETTVGRNRDSRHYEEQVIVETITDIINYPYFQVLDVWELEEKEIRKKKRIRTVNVYDNYLRAHKLWNKVRSNTRSRILRDTE